MLETSLLLMKSLNRTETSIFQSVGCSLFPKAIFLTFIHMCRLFCHCLFTISPSFGASESLCFVAFPGYLHLYFGFAFMYSRPFSKGVWCSLE